MQIIFMANFSKKKSDSLFHRQEFRPECRLAASVPSIQTTNLLPHQQRVVYPKKNFRGEHGWGRLFLFRQLINSTPKFSERNW